MKVLLVAPIHHYRDYFLQKGKTKFLKGQGQQSWLEALQSLKIQVSTFIYTDPVVFPQRTKLFFEKIENIFPRVYQKIKKTDDIYFQFIPQNYLINQKLIDMAFSKKPDVIFLSGGFTFLFPSTIKKLKKQIDCKTILFSGINPSIASTRSERKLINYNLIDYIVENDEGYANLWKKLGAKNTITLPISAVDPKLHRKITLTAQEKNEYACGVSFVGSITKERIPYFLLLREFDFKFWGDIKPNVVIPKDLKPFYKGLARGEKMIKIINASKICINLQPKDMTKGGNMRTFEIPGSGGFQLVDKIPSEYFKIGEEVVTFSSKEDFLKKVVFYLKNKTIREKIADSGYKRAHKDHVYIKRFEKLFKKI